MRDEKSRATSGGVARADKTVAPSWPDREAWARDRRTPYGDDLDKVAEAVSADPADYATPAELDQAARELHAEWNELGRELRTANHGARTVFPLHGHRPRTRASMSAIWTALDALSLADRAIVDHAQQLKASRQAINRAATELTAGKLGTFATSDALRFIPAGRCPTYRAVVARWQQACHAAGDAYRRDVGARPVDGQAWRRELDRRAQIQLARARGHLGGAR